MASQPRESSPTPSPSVTARSVLVAAAYVLRLVLLGFTPAHPLLAVGIDAVLLVSARWATTPGSLRYGADFGRHGHWTTVFWIPVFLAAVLFIRDLALLSESIGA